VPSHNADRTFVVFVIGSVKDLQTCILVCRRTPGRISQSERVPGKIQSLCHNCCLKNVACREGIFKGGVPLYYIPISHWHRKFGRCSNNNCKAAWGKRTIQVETPKESEKICIQIMIRDNIFWFAFWLLLVNYILIYSDTKPLSSVGFYTIVSARSRVVHLTRIFTSDELVDGSAVCDICWVIACKSIFKQE
jgi:hypothetical protein